MKTLREHMLDRDRAMEKRLDAMRATVLTAVAAKRQDEAVQTTDATDLDGRSARELLGMVWRELFVACRGTWATLAAVWLGLLALNTAYLGDQSAGAPPTAQELAAISAERREQQRQMAALSESATRPKKRGALPPRRIRALNVRSAGRFRRPSSLGFDI